MSLASLLTFFVILAQCHSFVNKPNIIVFLADDLGLGDIGCFGNSSLPTPNIDKLCKDGAKLSHHLSAAALCTPSRAAFMTGRYPIRMGLAQEIGSPPVVLYVSAKNGLPETEVTWPKMLQSQGYQTQAVGKWHLGWNKDTYGDQKHGPLGHGFDHFYGLPFTLVDGFDQNMPFFTYSKLMDDSFLHNHVTALALSFLTVFLVYGPDSIGYAIFVLIIIAFIVVWFFLEHFTLHMDKWWQRSAFMEKFLNSMLMKDNEVVEQPIRLQSLMQKLTKYSVNFIEQQEKGRPFALYHAFSAVHTPLKPGIRFKGQSKHGPYGDSVMEMDDAVGQVLEALQRKGLEDETLIYFTSDHGSHIDRGSDGGSNAPFKGGKGMDPLEGGIRVPGIIKWPKVVQPGTVIERPTSLLDFFPTILSLLKMNEHQHVNKVDGESYLELLEGREKVASTRILRHYCGTSLAALRIIEESGNIYKVYKKAPKVDAKLGHCGSNTLCSCFDNIDVYDDLLIYDLVADPTEQGDPLKKSTALYERLKNMADVEFEKASREINPSCQYLNRWDVMPRPWMQPCAAFPRCQT